MSFLPPQNWSPEHYNEEEGEEKPWGARQQIEKELRRKDPDARLPLEVLVILLKSLLTPEQCSHAYEQFEAIAVAEGWVSVETVNESIGRICPGSDT